MSDIVYAKSSVVLAHGGQRVSVRAGEPWVASDPLVAHYPDMFAAHVKAVRTTEDPRGFREYEPPIERGTRAPGEKRVTRRPRKPQNEQPEETSTEDTPGDE